MALTLLHHHRNPRRARQPVPQAMPLLAATALAAALLCLPAQAQQQPGGAAGAAAAITARVLARQLEWTPAAPHGRAVLRLARAGEAPQDIVLQRQPQQGLLVFSLQAHPLQDGRYTYELTLAPPSGTVRRDESGAEPTPPTGAMLSGSVTVAGGAFVLPPEALPPGENTDADGGAAPVRRSARLATKDQVVSDDQIGQGSLCVGFDCVNNESFGFDTLRLKENNLRIKFLDSSASAGFSANQWQLIANDSSSGGANYFGIDDVTGGKAPVRWLAGAPANSLYVSPQGRLGVRTAVPLLDVHVLSSNTPALRQEQNNTSGYVAQTWDIGANEANFFVRDVTNGSRLPLRIRPGAPHASLDISSNGDVGMGTPRPAAPLNLRRANGTAMLLVDNTAAPTAQRVPVELQNNGPVGTQLARGPGTAYWTQQATPTALSFAANGSGINALSVQSGGGLVVAGTLSQGSSRTLKHDIAAAPVHAILGEVAQLPLYAWRYLSDLPASLHLGPMAEDVHQRFQLGSSPQTLAPSDVAALAAATVQALHQKLAAKDEELLVLAERLSALERRLERQRGGRP